MPNPSNAPFVSPYSAKLALLTLLVVSLSWPAGAQAAPAPPGAVPAAPTSFAVANLRPALANVQTAIAGLNIGHWKVSSEARVNAQQDVASMQRDLSTTLPGLLAQVESPGPNGPAALSPTFAVFRNLDALYDVLLRVSETAALAASGPDASSLEDARAGLEDGRAKLGAWLLQAIGAQDAQIAHTQAPVSRAAPAPAAPNKIVVDDGPETAKPRKKKAAPPPAPQ
jgi:hypothetical protein